MQHYFEVDRLVDTQVWNGLRAGVEEDCARRYRDRKYILHEHFKKVGGESDIETAKNNPHFSQTRESWSNLIHGLFLDPKFMARSRKNKDNRAKQKYPSTGGSKSYSQSRHEEVRNIVDIFQTLEIFLVIVFLFLTVEEVGTTKNS